MLYFWSEIEKQLHNATCEGYRIELPISKADLVYWGKLHHHAIGSYNYYEDCKLVSIWKGKELQSCLEIRLVSKCYVVRQHRGKFCASPPFEESVRLKLENYILKVLNADVQYMS